MNSYIYLSLKRWGSRGQLPPRQRRSGVNRQLPLLTAIIFFSALEPTLFPRPERVGANSV